MNKMKSSALATLLLAASSQAFAADDGGPIKIGVVAPISGKSSIDRGESIIDGARTFAAEYNAAGGLLGRKIELVEKDDEATPDVGVRAVKDLITKDHVVAVVGFGNTGVAVAAVKELQKAHIPVITSGVSGVSVVSQFANEKASYVFRIGASDALQPEVLVDDLVDRRKLTKIALLHDSTPYGAAGAVAVEKALSGKRLDPVITLPFDVGQTDMTAIVQQIQSSGAQAVMVYGQGTEAAQVSLAMLKAKLKVPLVGPWSLSERGYVSGAGAAGEGARMSTDFIEEGVDTSKARFIDSYLRVNKVDRISAPAAAAQTYDALLLLTTAMAQVIDTDPVKVRDALEGLKYTVNGGILMTYKTPFSPTNHEATPASLLMMGEVHNQHVVYAYREDALRRVENPVSKN